MHSRFGKGLRTKVRAPDGVCGELTTHVAVAVGEEPGGDEGEHGAQDQEFVSDDQGGQHHEGQAADGHGGAGGGAGDDEFQRRPEQ